MLYSYAGIPERGFRLFKKREQPLDFNAAPAPSGTSQGNLISVPELPQVADTDADADAHAHADAHADGSKIPIDSKVQDVVELEVGTTPSGKTAVAEGDEAVIVTHNTMSELSVVLTSISILLAFR